MKNHLIPLFLSLTLLAVLPAAAKDGGDDKADYTLQTLLEERETASENALSGAAAADPSSLILLTWPGDPESVRYEVEILDGLPADLDRNSPCESRIFVKKNIYTNKVLIDLSALPASEHLYWRVRPIDADWEGMGPFSAPMEVRSTQKTVARNAPLPDVPPQGSGVSLLYPVYTYAGNPGAVKYEVEVTKKYPENPDGTEPSKYRVFSSVTSLSDVYDSEPRLGTFYWRVRGMDGDGNPVGIWSLPVRTGVEPDKKVDIAVFGDSITQGGGRLYHTPSDGAYSYISYLDFPAVNLGRSGDTVEMMVRRFDRDVLPFHVRYLLIMGGINDLRMGADPDKVIAGLQRIREKCLRKHIMPILMTLPPINPDNIARYYRESTYEGWRESVDRVNAYIRSQPHIDTAAPFAHFPVMPSEFALDGLHEDWNAKQMIAGEINRRIGDFRKADEEKTAGDSDKTENRKEQHRKK